MLSLFYKPAGMDIYNTVIRYGPNFRTINNQVMKQFSSRCAMALNYGLHDIGKSGSLSGELSKDSRNSAISLYIGLGF